MSIEASLIIHYDYIKKYIIQLYFSNRKNIEVLMLDILYMGMMNGNYSHLQFNPEDSNIAIPNSNLKSLF